MDKYLLIVNKQNHFDEKMLESFKMLPYKDEDGESFIEEKTLTALKALKQHMKEKYGYVIEDFSVGRTPARQQEVSEQIYKEQYEREKRKGSSDEEAKTHAQNYVNSYVAKPTESEHHTGLAFDVRMHNLLPKMVQKLADKVDALQKAIDKRERETGKTDEMFDALYKEMPEFGFILRYPKGKEEETGYRHERWHLRYVGKEHAKAIEKGDLTLEAYVKKLQAEQEQSQNQPGAY